MTIREAIQETDARKYNTYSQDSKVKWLSRLDGMLRHRIMDAYEGGAREVFPGYGPETPGSTVLLVGAPYDEMYLRWLEAQIDYSNGEYDKYNNSIAMYNAVFDAFAADYHRTHTPKSSGVIRF